MKLPEPHRIVQGFGMEAEYLYTAEQLRAEIELRDAVLRMALEALGNCVGDSLLGGKQREAAIKAIREILH